MSDEDPAWPDTTNGQTLSAEEWARAAVNERAMYVRMVAAPEGDGWGAELIARLMERATGEGYRRARVVVRADNERLGAYWWEQGFVRVDERETETEGGERTVELLERVLR